MSKKDDELNDFVDEVTDGAYNLPCLEVIGCGDSSMVALDLEAG